jgi:hypothetical protein
MLFPDAAANASPVITLSRAASAMRNGRDFFTDAIYVDLVTRGYYDRSPNDTRARWRNRATIVTSLSIVAGILLSWLLSPWMAAPAIAVTVLSIALRLIGRRMPRRTPAGAEATAKWLAFRRYLEDLEKYDKVDAARANFEAYLPYAVAFGLESVWISRFQNDAATPGWFDLGDLDGMPPVWPRIPHAPTVIVTGGHPQGWDFPNVNVPGLGDLSKGTASKLDDGSSGLKDVLNAIGVLIEIASLFSGGGGRGGSSGGGGGGFR